MFKRYAKSFWLFVAANFLLVTAVIVINAVSRPPLPNAGYYSVGIMFVLFMLMAVFGFWFTQPSLASGHSAFDRLCAFLIPGNTDLTPPEYNSRKSAIVLHTGLAMQFAARLLFELLTERNFAKTGMFSVLLLLTLSAFTIYRRDELLPREGLLLLIITVTCPVVLYLFENRSDFGISGSSMLLLLLPMLAGLFLFDKMRKRGVFAAFSAIMYVFMFIEVYIWHAGGYYSLFTFFISVFAVGFSMHTALELYINQTTAEYYNLSGTLKKLKDAQSMLVHHEKMVTLGQLIAGVAHEINTPIGAVKASAETLHSALQPAMVNLLKSGRTMSDEDIDDLAFFIELAVESFGEMNSSMSVRRTKNALRAYFTDQSIGDPTTFAEALSRIELVNIEKVKQNIDKFQKETCPRNLELLISIIPFINGTQTILFASEKVTKIVFALRSYAHTNVTGEAVSFDVSKTIDNVLVLYHNQLKMGVQVTKNYDNNLPEIVGNADELGQVWTNLIQNALQAMNNNGQLHVSIGREGDNFLSISFADSGAGIKEEDAAKIFDPFYTTKSLGEGTGLGLDISRSIVEKHDGSITFTSKVGVGTTFTVKLPINKEANNG